MHNSITRARFGGVLVLALGLSACGTEAAPDVASSDSPATRPAHEQASGPESCGALSLVEGATISGEDLGACLVDYLAFAGSGASNMQSGTASSRMVWRMGKEYEAYAELDSGVRMTTAGGRSWIDFDGTGWVEADPATPGMEVAFGIIQAWREASAPEVTRRMIAASPGWKVGPWRDAALPDDTSRNLASVTAAAPFSWGGATISSMTLWMDAPGRVILQEATASAAGITADTTTLYTRWGEPVEIPDPAATAGAR